MARPVKHVLFGLAGALAFGAAGAIGCALLERSYEAAAPVAIVSGATTTGAIDMSAARALLATEPVLRRAAMRPKAAGAIERYARPSTLDRLTPFLTAQSADIDTLSRAVSFLAPRVDVRVGPWPDTIEIVARMPSPGDAAALATAVAEAFAADLNETALTARRRGAKRQAERMERASRRLDDAREKTQSLRATDPLPVATLARAPAGPDKAAALDRARREMSEAAARVAEVARVYGPRHPELLRRETDARAAKAALESAARLAASARPTPPASAPAPEGGPDPRAADIAAAEEETARAQAALDLEMSRNETERREARVLRPAATPVRSSGPSSALVVAVAAFGGLLLTGAAPAFATGCARTRTRVRDRPIARLRGGGFDECEGRRALAALQIAEGRGARRICVIADDDSLAARGAKALALAALAEGWRPLLIAGPSDDMPEERGRAAVLDGANCTISAARTRGGKLDVARPAPRPARRLQPLDAELAYDLVIGGATGRDRTTRAPDCIVRIAQEASDEGASRICGDLGIDPARFAGTIIIGRLS